MPDALGLPGTHDMDMRLRFFESDTSAQTLDLVVEGSRHLANWVPPRWQHLDASSAGIGTQSHEFVQTTVICSGSYGSSLRLCFWLLYLCGWLSNTPRDFVRYPELFNEPFLLRLTRDHFCYLQLKILADGLIRSFTYSFICSIYLISISWLFSVCQAPC